MNTKYKKILSWLLVLIWLVVIFTFSSMNSIDSNAKSEKTINKVLETTIDTTNNLGITNKHPKSSKINNYVTKLNFPLRKCMHAFVYFILGLLVLNALKISNITNYRQYLICLIFCFICSLFDEYYQTFIDGRTGQIMDSIIDTIGTTISIIGYYLLNKIKNKFKFDKI